MFARANIRNQNPLKNERHHYFYSWRMSPFLLWVFWMVQTGLCIAVSHSYWYWFLVHWIFLLWLFELGPLILVNICQTADRRLPSTCLEMKKTTVTFTILKSNVWVNTALGKNPPLNSLPGNPHSSIYPEGRSTFPGSLAPSKQKTAYDVCARPQKDTGRFGALKFLYLEYRTIHTQEDTQLHCEKTSVCIMALLTYPWEDCSLQRFIHLAQGRCNCH